MEEMDTEQMEEDCKTEDHDTEDDWKPNGQVRKKALKKKKVPARRTPGRPRKRSPSSDQEMVSEQEEKKPLINGSVRAQSDKEIMSPLHENQSYRSRSNSKGSFLPGVAAGLQDAKRQEDDKSSAQEDSTDVVQPLKENGVNGDARQSTEAFGTIEDVEEAEDGDVPENLISEEELSDEGDETDQPPRKRGSPPKLSSRRTSRSCRPNTLIFTSDMTTNSPPKKKIGRPRKVMSAPAPVVEHPRNDLRRPKRNASYVNSVKKAVSALNTSSSATPRVKARGRPRKTPVVKSEPEEEDESEDDEEEEEDDDETPVPTPSPKKSNPIEKLKTPKRPKLSPMLTSILSGQPIANTKTGRPKGRPRKFAALATPSSSDQKASTSTPGKCNCEAKYRVVFMKLEETLESKHLAQTKKLRADLEERDNENIRLAARNVALQKEVEMLQRKMKNSMESEQCTKDVEILKAQYKDELSKAKRLQWCGNCQREAIYFCCWNNSYCSLECQQQHWHAEHKRECRRQINPS